MEVLAAFAAAHGITYPLLADAGSVVIRRLGLYNEHLAAQHAAYGGTVRPEQEGVAYPGVFLLDTDGRVRQKRFWQSYREREAGAALLEQGFGLPATTPGPVVTGGSDGVRVRLWLDGITYRFFQRRWLTVEVVPAPGLHVYGAPCPVGYVPLGVEVAAAADLAVGPPTWPAPRPFQVAGLDERFHVYDGPVSGVVPLTFTSRDAGDLELVVTVRYQACSDTDCHAPAAVTLTVPVAAAPLVR